MEQWSHKLLVVPGNPSMIHFQFQIPYSCPAFDTFTFACVPTACCLKMACFLPARVSIEYLLLNSVLFDLMLQLRLHMHSYSSFSQICCFSWVSPSCMPIIYYEVTVIIKPWFTPKLYDIPTSTDKGQIFKFGQILDISSPNPVWKKLDIQKFSTLVLVGIGQKILGKWHL